MNYSRDTYAWYSGSSGDTVNSSDDIYSLYSGSGSGEAWNSSNDSYIDYEEYEYYYNINTKLEIYVYGVLLFGGLFGNILSFIVLQTKTYRKTPTGFLLSALAVWDSLSLLIGLLDKWISMKCLSYIIDMHADL